MLAPSCDTDSLRFENSKARLVFSHIAFWCACGSAVSILLSIAVSQSLLGIAIAAYLLSGQSIRVPPVWLPLGLFLLGTLISLLASGNPAIGMPQIRKLYVYLMLAVVYSVVRSAATATRLFLAWCVTGVAGSLLGIGQFLQKWEQARELHRDFYPYYLVARITGFMSHWMTFSGEQMLVLIVLAAFLLFGRVGGRTRVALWLAGGLALALALVLSDTRSVWIALVVAFLYLTWSRKPWLVALVPIVAAIAFFIAPAEVQERVTSIVKPHGDMDSNDFRVVVWRTGIRMIRAHPLLGLGPEEVHAQFYQWLPPDTPRPLPSGYYGHLHSIYIHYAAERGIPTMLMLVWMMAMIIYDCWRALRRLPAARGDLRFILHAVVACVLAIAVEGFAELNLGDSEVLTMFLVLTACAYVAMDEVKKIPAPAI